MDRYAYVNNNPVRYTDPSGHMRVEDPGESRGCGFKQVYCKFYANNPIKPTYAKKKDAGSYDPTGDILGYVQGVFQQFGEKPNVWSHTLHITLPLELGGTSGSSTFTVSPTVMSGLGKVLFGVGLLIQMAPAQIQNFQQGTTSGNEILADGVIDAGIYAVSAIAGAGAGIGTGLVIAGLTAGVATPEAALAGVAVGAVTSALVSNYLNNYVAQNNIREQYSNYLSHPPHYDTYYGPYPTTGP